MSILAFALAASLVAAPPGDTPETELKRLQGTWILAAEEIDGRPVALDKLAPLSFTVQGDELAITVRGEVRSVKLKVDPSQEPRTMDWFRGDGVALRAVYAWDKESLKVCSSSELSDRPTKVATAPGDHHRIRVWKRSYGE